MGARHALAKAMGVDYKQRLERLQLQVGCHKAILVEGDAVRIIFPLLIQVDFREQREFLSICGPVPAVGIGEGLADRGAPCAPQYS